jgi:hypothetical protein
MAKPSKNNLVVIWLPEPEPECQEALTQAFRMIFDLWHEPPVDNPTGQNSGVERRLPYPTS